MNATIDLSHFDNTPYPNREVVDPRKKTPAWVRQMVCAGLTNFLRAKPDWKMWAHDDTVAENISYALGQQDTLQYRKLAVTGKTLNANSIEVTNRGPIEGDEDTGPLATDPMALDSIIKARPLPLLPVKLAGLKSTILAAGYEATITALGKKADDEYAEYEANLRMWVNHGEDFKKAGISAPTELPDPMPQTESEIQTYLDDYQVGAAADLERKILIVTQESGTKQQLSECADDLLQHGYACLSDFQLPGKRCKGKRIMVHRGLFSKSVFPDYRDMNEGGYLETITYDELRAEIRDKKLTCRADGKQWGDEEWAALREMANRNMPKTMGDIDEALGLRENTGSITVVRWYFRTDDLRQWRTKKDDAGNVRTRPIKDADYEPEEGIDMTKLTVNCLYEATLIVGSGLAYNCRKAYDQGRDLHDPLQARMPFAIFSTQTVGGHAISVTERAKGIMDEIERSWRAFMAVRRTYTPAGNNIPPDLLDQMAEAMNFKGEDKAMKAYKFIKQVGDSFFPRIDSDNPNMPVVNPITANPFGMPKEAAEHLKEVFDQLQLLEAVTGANAVVSAATPQGDAMGKGVNQIALQGAANVMMGLRDGLQLMFENHSRNLAGRIWLTEHEVPVTGSVAGRTGRSRQVKARPDLHEYSFHMKVELAPTEQEWQDLYNKANEATKAGQLTYADEMKLRWFDNLKTAQRYFAMACDRKIRNDEAKALNLQKANGDVQTQTGQAVSKAQQETDAAKHGQVMEQLQFTRETEWGKTDRQLEVQERIASQGNNTKVVVAEIQEDGEDGRHVAQAVHDEAAAVRDAALQQAAVEAAPAEA